MMISEATQKKIDELIQSTPGRPKLAQACGEFLKEYLLVEIAAAQARREFLLRVFDCKI